MQLEEYYEKLKDKTWLGQKVQVHNIKFNNLRKYIPKFRRESFWGWGLQESIS